MGIFLFCPLFSMLFVPCLVSSPSSEMEEGYNPPTPYKVCCRVSMPCTVLHMPAVVVHDDEEDKLTYLVEKIWIMHILPFLQVVLNTWPPMQCNGRSIKAKSLQFLSLLKVLFHLFCCHSIQPWKQRVWWCVCHTSGLAIYITKILYL